MPSYLQIEIEQRGILRPRELVLVLARRDNHLYLDYEKRDMSLFLRFFEDELDLSEDVDKKAQEIILKKGLAFRKMDYLGSIFPQHGNYDRIYVYLASEIRSFRAVTMISLSLKEVIDAMKSGLFLGSRCEKALGLYLRFLKEELPE